MEIRDSVHDGVLHAIRQVLVMAQLNHCINKEHVQGNAENTGKCKNTHGNWKYGNTETQGSELCAKQGNGKAAESTETRGIAKTHNRETKKRREFKQGSSGKCRKVKHAGKECV
jgi:hypothetical protein